MERTAAQADSQALTLLPNHYELKGRDTQVTYSATSIIGEPLLRYRDSRREVTARGKEIRQVKTELGMLVTVTLVPAEKQHTLLTFSLLLPRAELRTSRDSVRLSTQGILTYNQRPGPVLSASGRQVQRYRVVRLVGMGSLIFH